MEKSVCQHSYFLLYIYSPPPYVMLYIDIAKARPTHGRWPSHICSHSWISSGKLITKILDARLVIEERFWNDNLPWPQATFLGIFKLSEVTTGPIYFDYNTFSRCRWYSVPTLVNMLLSIPRMGPRWLYMVILFLLQLTQLFPHNCQQKYLQ